MQKYQSNYKHFFELALASVFLYHGLAKFPMLKPMAEMLQMPVVMILLIALAETAGGTLVLL